MASRVSVLRYSSLFLGICLLNCSRKMSNIKALNLIVNYPTIQVLSESNTVYSNLLDTISIYYINDYVVYQLSAVRQYESSNKVFGSEPYFIYKKNDTIGRLYNSIHDFGNGINASIDSILFARAYTGMKLDITDSTSYKIVSIRSNHEILEKFVSRLPSSNSLNVDSVFFYYTVDLKGFDYSFSKKIDSLKGMKLYKIRLLYNAKLNETKTATYPAREFFFEIQKKNISDSDSAVVNLVKRYDKTYSRSR